MTLTAWVPDWLKGVRKRLCGWMEARHGCRQVGARKAGAHVCTPTGRVGGRIAVQAGEEWWKHGEGIMTKAGRKREYLERWQEVG